MSLVKNVKQICARRKITIRELEHRAKLPENSIYKWDTNRPSVDKVAAVAAALQVTIDECVNDK